MKSNRMRLFKSPNPRDLGSRSVWIAKSHIEKFVSLADMPRPVTIAPIAPDKIVEDILISTLVRVKNSAKPEIAAAAARYLSLLQQNA